MSVQETFRRIIPAYAALLAEHKAAFSGSRLVQPNAEFFPDKIDVTPEGLRTLFERVLSYSPVPQDVPFEIGFVESDAASAGASAKSCASGACGASGASGASGEEKGAGLLPSVVEQEDLYIIPLDVTLVRNPVRLTTSLARSAGGLLLAYTDEHVTGPKAELAAVLTGFGVLLLNGAHMYMKGCSSVKLLVGTDLNVRELAASLALFVSVTGASARDARKTLQPTQDEAFTEAMDFIKTQAELIQKLQTAPELLAGGAFEFEGPRGVIGFFGSLFGNKRAGSEDSGFESGAYKSARQARTPEQEARLAEARQLVEEVGLFSD
jgi:hypothetical protein